MLELMETMDVKEKFNSTDYQSSLEPRRNGIVQLP
jgi:hypothetical protein